jgi:F-type H+-transporting ATPase subunit a
MTIGLGLTFFVMSIVWAIKYNGLGGFFHHIFGVKGGMKGVMFWLLVPIFFFVGLLEVISMCIRPVALGMRLYGNIYGGESVLTIMLGLMDYGLAAIPFYFFELMIAVVQATVFTILTLAFLSSLCSHSDDHHSEEGAH